MSSVIAVWCEKGCAARDDHNLPYPHTDGHELMVDLTSIHGHNRALRGPWANNCGGAGGGGGSKEQETRIENRPSWDTDNGDNGTKRLMDVGLANSNKKIILRKTE
jgi:hypothetical protein